MLLSAPGDPRGIGEAEASDVRAAQQVELCESRWRSAYRSRKPPRLMCVMRGIPLGVEVTVAVRLSANAGVAPVLRLAARGTVVRTEPRPDGSWGVAVEFTRRRIL